MSGGRFLEVVQALCDEPVSARLLGLSPESATLVMPDDTACVVVDASVTPPDELEDRLRRYAARVVQVSLKFVAVGGTPAHRSALARVQPRFAMGRAVQVFALEPDGQTWAGARSRLDSPTGRALTSIAGRTPREVDPTALAARVVTADPDETERAREVQSFVAKTASGRPWAVWTLLFGIAGVFALEWLWGGTELTPTLHRMGANLPSRWLQEPWRLLSSAWLHAGPMHVAVNAFALWMLGSFIERLLGWPRLVLLYVAAALGGSIASAIGSDASLSVGASGAIWGILGAATALAWRPAGIVPAAVLPQLRRNALVNIALNLMLSMRPEIDLLAHVGGGIVGAALVASGLLTRGIAAGDRTRRLGTAAWIVGAVFVASLPIAWLHDRPWALDDLEPLQRVTLSERGDTIQLPPTLTPPGDTPGQPGVVAVGDLRVDGYELHAAVSDRSEFVELEARSPREFAALALDTSPDNVILLEGADAPAWPTFIRRRHDDRVGVVSAVQVRDDAILEIVAAYWLEFPQFGPALEAAVRSYDRP